MDRSSYVMDIMSRAPVVVGPETLAANAADHATRHGVHYLLVIEGYRLRGVVCSCDLLGASPRQPVADCMHAPVTIDDQASGADCVDLMSQRSVGCLPVVDWSGALSGVITRHDLRKVGLLHDGKPRCASCDSSHGLGPDAIDAQVVFCRRCLEESCPATAEDESYFTMGGED